MTVKALLTFDVDFQLLWTGTFHKTSLAELARGEYGARVGLPRILDLLEKENIKATFFVPAKMVEIYPELILKISESDHEIGLHGFAHERWNTLSEQEEDTLLRKGKQVLENLIGKEIIGFRSPAWNLNTVSPELLLKNGFKYDSSLMADDFTPYYLRIGDQATIEGDLTFGKESDLLEIPVAWELDDFPYFARTNHQTGLASPEFVMNRWLEEFYYASTIENSVYTLTLHPQVIGRGPRITMLEIFIKKIKQSNPKAFCKISDCLLTLGG